MRVQLFLRTWQSWVRLAFFILVTLIWWWGIGRWHRGCSWIVFCTNVFFWLGCQTLNFSLWWHCSCDRPILLISFCLSTLLLATLIENQGSCSGFRVFSTETCPLSTRLFTVFRWRVRRGGDWRTLSIFWLWFHLWRWWIWWGKISWNLWREFVWGVGCEARLLHWLCVILWCIDWPFLLFWVSTPKPRRGRSTCACRGDISFLLCSASNDWWDISVLDVLAIIFPTNLHSIFQELMARRYGWCMRMCRILSTMLFHARDVPHLWESSSIIWCRELDGCRWVGCWLLWGNLAMRIFCLHLLSGFYGVLLYPELLRKLKDIAASVLAIFLPLLSRLGTAHLWCTQLFVLPQEHCSIQLCWKHKDRTRSKAVTSTILEQLCWKWHSQVWACHKLWLW